MIGVLLKTTEYYRIKYLLEFELRDLIQEIKDHDEDTPEMLSLKKSTEKEFERTLELYKRFADKEDIYEITKMKKGAM